MMLSDGSTLSGREALRARLLGKGVAHVLCARALTRALARVRRS